MPGRALHRLGDHRGHLVAARRHQRGQRLDVVGRHLDHVVDERAEVLLVRGDALRARAAVGDAVVAAGAGDDQLALRLPGLHVGDAHELHHRVDRLAARAAQEHPGVGHRADGHQLLGEQVGRLVGERVEARVGGERAQLRGRRRRRSRRDRDRRRSTRGWPSRRRARCRRRPTPARPRRGRCGRTRPGGLGVRMEEGRSRAGHGGTVPVRNEARTLLRSEEVEWPNPR